MHGGFGEKKAGAWTTAVCTVHLPETGDGSQKAAYTETRAGDQ